MKERPILFSGPSVRAILGGRKPETRRPMRPQPVLERDGLLWWHYSKHAASADAEFRGQPWSEDWLSRCPYGQPGDLLYVKEAVTRSGGFVQYVADTTTSRHLWPAHWKRDPQAARFMPKAFARLWLRVLAVRVERLQEIDEAGAIGEGVDAIPQADAPRQATWSRRADFAQLWDRINGDRATWESNPWVWVVRFQVA